MNAASTLNGASTRRSEPQSGALDKAALAVGSALVAWSRRRSARMVEPVNIEELMIQRAAEREAQAVLAERHAGANYQLYRMF
jgi:hypothetical protein